MGTITVQADGYLELAVGANENVHIMAWPHSGQTGHLSLNNKVGNQYVETADYLLNPEEGHKYLHKYLDVGGASLYLRIKDVAGNHVNILSAHLFSGYDDPSMNPIRVMRYYGISIGSNRHVYILVVIENDGGGGGLDALVPPPWSARSWWDRYANVGR